MKRRHFIKTTAAAITMPVFLNGMGVSAIAKTSLFSNISDETNRALVVIQLNGGNDGLNTIIPLDQYDKLANIRANLLLPENSILELNPTNGFHPSMGGFKSLFDNGKLGILQSVGYPNQNRSHFRSTDIWQTASAADETLTTGWLGRFFEKDNPSFPEDYPNASAPDPFALTIGSVVSETCQGSGGNFSLAINDPFNLNPLTAGGEDEVPETPYGDELTFLRQTIAQTNAYADTITEAANKGNSLATYPDGNRLAEQLRNVALLISGGLKTKVYVVSLGGFDTHGNQAIDGNPTAGTHAELLQMLSTAVEAFQTDIELLGLEKRVVGMTFSEFGRRIRSNDSIGTDHGDAAPLLLFGGCVKPGILGNNPEIPDEVGVGDGVPMQYDFRNVYGSVLMEWFEVPEEDVKNILFNDFQYLPILNFCGKWDTIPHLPSSQNATIPGNDLTNFPNPFSTVTTIKFLCEEEHVRLSVLNSFGQQVALLVDKTLGAGAHSIRFDASKLPPGSYYCHLQLADGSQKTKQMSVVK